jgi:hypothetical protein
VAASSALCVSSAEISRILLETCDGSGCINFSERNDSDVDYAQEENWNEADDVLQDVDDNIVAHDSDTQWIQRAVQTSYRGQKIRFTEQCGP